MYDHFFWDIKLVSDPIFSTSHNPGLNDVQMGFQW